MKKTVLLIVLVFATLYSFSQYKKGASFLSINGMYSKNSSETGVNFNSVFIQGKYINAGISLTNIISNNFLIGAGLDYNNQNETRQSKLIILDRYIQVEDMYLKSNILVPNIFVGYYYKIAKSFYFNTNLKFRLGENYSKTEYLQALATPVTNTSYLSDTSPSSAHNGAYETKTDYFSTSLLPELTYFISDKTGFTLGLGGIEYALNDWKSENSSFTINFNPNNWLVGVKIQL